MSELQRSLEVIENLRAEHQSRILFNDLTSVLFNEGYSNFHGGIGSIRTFHEKLFHMICPALKSQVVFGSGKGGYEKYGIKKVTVDFYDPDQNIVYEVDGKNHNRELQKLKDLLKEQMLFLEYGIATYRITNDYVEELFMKSVRLKGGTRC